MTNESHLEFFDRVMMFMLVLALPLVLFVRRIGDSKKEKTLLSEPPLLPMGFLETIKNLSGPNGPWFVYNVFRSQQLKVFRLKVIPFDKPYIFVGDAKVARTVLKESGSVKTPLYEKIFPFGSNIFSSNGKRWHHARKAVAPAFNKQHVARMNRIVVDQIEDWIKNVLIGKIENQEPIDICEEMLRQILKGIAAAAFQYDLSQKEADMFLCELELVLKDAAKKMVNPIYILLDPFLASGRRTKLAKKRIIQFVRTILQHYYSIENPIEGTVISMIVKNDQYNSEDERINDLLVFLVGGHDTTAHTISWTLLEIARNPLEQDKLYNALRDIPKEERANLNELSWVVKESMRLNPVAADGGGRVLPRDIVAGGYLLTKGSNVGLNFLALHRSEEYFSKPNDFDPSRWIDPSEDEALALMPFSFGQRNCVGQSLAQAEVFNILATLLVDYEFSIFNEGAVDFFLTMKPMGAKLLVKKRGTNGLKP